MTFLVVHVLRSDFIVEDVFGQKSYAPVRRVHRRAAVALLREEVVLLGNLVQLTLVLVGGGLLDWVLAQVMDGHHRLVQHQRLQYHCLW